MLLAQTTADFWIGVGSLGSAILGGGFAMAWRLGRLEQRVSDLKDDIREVKTDLTADVAAVDKRVEAFLIRGWVDLVDRERR